MIPGKIEIIGLNVASNDSFCGSNTIRQRIALADRSLEGVSKNWQGTLEIYRLLALNYPLLLVQTPK